MRVLVTGADGFVGQHLAEALLGRGDDVLGAIHGAEPQPGTLPAAAVARVDWRTFDLRDAASVEALVEGSAPEVAFNPPLKGFGFLAARGEGLREPDLDVPGHAGCLSVWPERRGQCLEK